ncbi:hypothetical protein OXPF_35560 [Oxobacter pfennigii]|uniref:ABC-2 family transporter protein n=1 Tax=Oxobacter pfennigii TaxID=36849 RepID=A0A0P8WWZ0_9CLOT|nr:ABC-2 transporter permease [Oxobacter pfennigii]KPU42793.1 hypothetical protein OXPF_35560 [Oxobacter pfennigii]
MLNLIIKDIVIQKRSLPTILFLTAIMIVSFQGTHGNGAYIVGSAAVVFILLSGAFAYDEKYRADMLLNSLPVSRKGIVVSRYLSVFAFSIIAVLIMSCAGIILNVSGLPLKIGLISLTDIAVIYAGIIIMSSIYLPIYFKFGYVKSRIFNMILYILTFGGSALISGIRQVLAEEFGYAAMPGFFNYFNLDTAWLLVTTIVLLLSSIMLASVIVSIKVYRSREF